MSVDLKKLTALAGQVREKQQRRPQTAVAKPWRITNVSAEVTEVWVYGDIGEDWFGDGVSAEAFAQELAAISTPKIHVRVNSQGGEVFEGVAIHEAIKRHPAATTGFVDGIAASAASFIVIACDVVKMAKTGRLMVHDAGIGGIYIAGNAAALRESVQEVLDFANLLDSLSDTIAQIYADKAGGSVEDWRAVMAKDKWYTADEAVAAGLADGIVGQEDDPAPSEQGSTQETTDRWDPNEFANILKGVFA